MGQAPILMFFETLKKPTRVNMIDEKISNIDSETWLKWVDLNYRLGMDPSVHGTAKHLLYIGRKI